MRNEQDVHEALNELITNPNLENARKLENVLRNAGAKQQILGRPNQKSSIGAAPESDRGFVERLANAFDASLTAARIAAGVSSSPELRPRACVQRFLCADTSVSDWRPTIELDNFLKPTVQIWLEDSSQKNRFRKFNPGDGLATVMVRDQGLGLKREEMSKTILELNSESKLKVFEAIGQFGHGGSSALSFCESCLIITQARSSPDRARFSWTLIVCEEEREQSKQQLVRKWFSSDDDLPFEANCTDFPSLNNAFPGTSIWHFGFNRGGWINQIAGPRQNNPWGRIGRLLFSYPLPFELIGNIARTDTPQPHRSIDGAFFRLLKLHSTKNKKRIKDNKPDKEIEYYSDEISESLIVEGQQYGSFSVYIFALTKQSQVSSYVEPSRPVILTLNGQNHGELTRTLFNEANLAELAACCIVEVRLDELDDEALNEIISNSRDIPKNTAFTRALKAALTKLIGSDEMLRALEEQRQMDKARKISSGLSDKLSKFLSTIVSDAVAEPSALKGGSAPGSAKSVESGAETKTRLARPEIPEVDPPTILEFLSNTVEIPEGTTAITKFKSDARPPKYSFHSDNPRCFVSLEQPESTERQLTITGKHEISPNGYGSISIYCPENQDASLTEACSAGKLILTMQCTDGRTLRAELNLAVGPRPVEYYRRRRPDIRANIMFVAPDNFDVSSLRDLLGEENILPFSDATLLPRYAEVLQISDEETTYWGDKSEHEGQSILTVEINAANPDLKYLLESCELAEERMLILEHYVHDIVFDCYQHCFKLEELPDQISEVVFAQAEDKPRAAEIHLNHQKAIRIACMEKKIQKQAVLR